MKKYYIVIIVLNILLYFDQINGALLPISDFFQKHSKILPTPKCLKIVYIWNML